MWETILASWFVVSDQLLWRSGGHVFPLPQPTLQQQGRREPSWGELTTPTEERAGTTRQLFELITCPVFTQVDA